MRKKPLMKTKGPRFHPKVSPVLSQTVLELPNIEILNVRFFKIQRPSSSWLFWICSVLSHGMLGGIRRCSKSTTDLFSIVLRRKEHSALLSQRPRKDPPAASTTYRWPWGISQCPLSSPGPELCSCHVGCTCRISETLNIPFRFRDAQHTDSSANFIKPQQMIQQIPWGQSSVVRTFIYIMHHNMNTLFFS